MPENDEIRLFDQLTMPDRLADAGITIPLVPGIMPITNFATASRFAATCGAGIPDWMAKLYEGLEDDPENRRLVAATHSAELCRRLQAEDVREFHFYTLNRSDATRRIYETLGVKDSAALR